MKDTLARVLDSTQQFFTDEESHGTEPAPADALALLARDHREVEALFKEVLADDSDGLTKRRQTIERIVRALELHAKVEETLLYPAIRQKTKRDTDDRHEILEAYEEHGSVKDLLRKIKRSTGRDETLRAKVQVLSEIVEHHVKEEEASLFSEARKLLGEKKLLAIGGEIAKMKARAERRGSPAKAKASAPRAKRAAPRAKSASKARSSK